MEDMMLTVSLPKNPLITIKIFPGHFATTNSHVSHYLDMSELKSNAAIARDVAKELSIPYVSSKLVDTIVCMDGTEVIGAYLAEELMRDGTSVMNSGSDINIVTPIYNVKRKLIFLSNVQKMILNKNVILLVASVSSRRTIIGALECIEYYGGKVAGISALYNALTSDSNHEIHTVFASNDIPDYRFFTLDECVLCKEGIKIDAIINSEGYSKI